MKHQLLELVSDTLSFLEVDLPSPLKKRELQKPPPAPILKRETKPPLSKVMEEPAKQESKKSAESPTIFSTIQKHLPHIRLVENIPSMQQVAVVAFRQEDLPFLKNLAKAIQKRLCPVKLLDGKKCAETQNWAAFTLVISQEEIDAKEKILLAPIAFYQNNAEEKKRLWSTICQHLSPKSS